MCRFISLVEQYFLLLIILELFAKKKSDILSFRNSFITISRWETKFSPAWPGSPGTTQPLEAAATKEISPNRLWHLVGGLHRGLHGGSHVPANYAKPETAFEQIEISPAFEAAVANYGRQQSGMLSIKAVWHNSVLFTIILEYLCLRPKAIHTL